MKVMSKENQKPQETTKKAKPVWSGWDDNKDWVPTEGFSAVYDLGDYEM